MCMRCVPEDGSALPAGYCEGKRARGVCIEQNETRAVAAAAAGLVTLALRMPGASAGRAQGASPNAAERPAAPPRPERP